MTSLTRIIPNVTWRRHADGFETAVVFEPGWNDHMGETGVHGMDIRFVMRGPKGAVQFTMTTGWVPGERGTDPMVSRLFPMGMDLGYYAYSPQREGQEQDRRECPYLDGQACFYDGSALPAEPILEAFVTLGEPPVWKALRNRHDDLHATILGA